MKKLLFPYLLLALSFIACSLSIPTPNLRPTSLPSPSPNSLPTLSAYPGLHPSLTPLTLSSPYAYPAPVPSNTSTPVFPLSGYESQTDDTGLKRDQAAIDMAGSRLVGTTPQPVQVKAILTGSLPDSCHDLRVVVAPEDSGGVIVIQAYSLFDPKIACATAVEPFTVSIPLGSYATGQHVVIVTAGNTGGHLGQFDANYAPQPGDVLITRGEVTLDMDLTGLAVTGGNWNMPAVNLQGTMQNSCQMLRIVLPPPDNENKVNLEVYSVFDPQSICTKVTQPFKVVYPLGYAGSGQSTVYVNGQYVGKFNWGG